jgi:adenine-specific DNA-methyltransferase
MSGSDTPHLRKDRGAFFTPEPIAEHLAEWAVSKNPQARILDPTCGEAVFLLAAGRHLRAAGCPAGQLEDRLFGVDLHASSLNEARLLLQTQGLDARLLPADFFSLSTPAQLGCELPEMDAVIGNPPFVRYQRHVGEPRKRALEAALAQKVRLSGLASSWAPLLAHACGFLKPEGRLAMVLPAELLTVGYAEPVRRWLMQRFERVHLVFFEQLQFADAQEKVVLVVAGGQGPSSGAFSVHYVQSAEDLADYWTYDGTSIPTVKSGKWSDLLISSPRRTNLFRRVSNEFVSLEEYGRPELGTVTGANSFFTLTETTRRRHGLAEDQLLKISPPGTKHLRGTSFRERDWQRLRELDERVWLLWPNADDDSAQLVEYLAVGEALGVHLAYKCTIRDPWWRPPVVPAPDLFFTYMSHRYPRLISNTAKVTFLNSMHGLRLRQGHRGLPKAALPLLTLNSVTMIGAEVGGRSYGGGILKMEPREAALLPVPAPDQLEVAWEIVKHERVALEEQLREGSWVKVVDRIDDVLLREVMEVSREDAQELALEAMALREQRIGRKDLGRGE